MLQCLNLKEEGFKDKLLTLVCSFGVEWDMLMKCLFQELTEMAVFFLLLEVLMRSCLA